MLRVYQADILIRNPGLFRVKIMQLLLQLPHRFNLIDVQHQQGKIHQVKQKARALQVLEELDTEPGAVCRGARLVELLKWSLAVTAGLSITAH